MKFFQKPSLASVVFFLPLVAHANCGSAFCTLNTDWDIQGVATRAGMRLDLRGEYISQDQLRNGNHKSKLGGEVGEHDELRTINRNFLATLDWNINSLWGLTLKVPFIKRTHQHVFNADDGAGGINPEPEKWNFSGSGDLQTLARYSFYKAKDSNAGLRFGLKLPTGNIHEKNSEGEVAERSLQPGTGSVDSLLGAYYNRRLGNINWFVQGMWQHSLSERDQYEPGDKLNADIGMSYSATPDLSLLLQLNLQYKNQDTGRNAESEDSGSRTVSVSPGLSYSITNNTQLYGFVQVPIDQYVHGAQLTSNWSAAFGVNTSF